MINDVIDSAKNNIQEKLSNPFWGAFIISWIGWNWRIIYISFFVSEDKLGTNRLEYVEQYANIINFLALPLFFSIIITLLIPHITLHVQLYKTKIRKRQEDKQKEIEEKVDIVSISNAQYHKLIRDKKSLQSINRLVKMIGEGKSIDEIDKIVPLGLIENLISNSIINEIRAKKPPVYEFTIKGKILLLFYEQDSTINN